MVLRVFGWAGGARTQRQKTRRCRGAPGSETDSRSPPGEAPPIALVPGARGRHQREIGRRRRERLRPAPRPPRAAASRWRKRAGRPAAPAAPRCAGSAAGARPVRRGLRGASAIWRRGCAARSRCRGRATSTNTRSKLPAWRLTHLSRSLASARRSTLPTPARRSRRAARSSRRAETSQATSLPRLAIPAANAKRLAAGAGAEIDDPHPRPRAGQQGGDLRALVLHLEQPVLERGETGQRRPLGEAQADRRPGGRLGADALGGERPRAPSRGRSSAG